MPVACCFGYYNFVVYFEVWVVVSTTRFVLFAQDCFSYSESFVVPYKS
uniref:Macaca fascicularis brain cDNA clone: QflA-21201, similar to human similar to LINE-1 REVERSE TRANSCRIPTASE HOMOLOG(LOC401620), mRNA, RefSeq: XM_377062.1 n=1 Tax=Macaca fascicularis TaxID=9541 RepID=I7GD38_MACFA|nr:unnamed protein product [Macaca fascicularis]